MTVQWRGGKGKGRKPRTPSEECRRLKHRVLRAAMEATWGRPVRRAKGWGLPEAPATAAEVLGLIEQWAEYCPEEAGPVRILARHSYDPRSGAKRGSRFVSWWLGGPSRPVPLRWSGEGGERRLRDARGRFV